MDELELYDGAYAGPQIDEAIGRVLSNQMNGSSNRNLLDNAYFVGGGSQQGGGQFPINQRGNASYSGGGGGYLIDRWKRINSINCSLQSDCLQITETNWGLRQVVGMPPGKYTFSMLARKLTYPSGGGMGFNSYHDIGSGWEILGNDWGLYTETVVATSNLGNANLQFNANLGSYSIEILAMKLELGSTQTLAHQENGMWVLNDIPNYAEEFAKCRDYFYRVKAGEPLYGSRSIGAANYSSFRVPVIMRATPTATKNGGTITIYGQNGTQYGFSSFNNGTIDYNAIGVYLSQNASYAGEKLVMFNSGGTIDLSSEP